MARFVDCAMVVCFGHQRHSPCDCEDEMNVIGLLVKGLGGEEYLVTTGPDSATGAGAFLIFRRDAGGWVPASLTREEEALVQADTSVALYKMARQAGTAGSTPIGPQGA